MRKKSVPIPTTHENEADRFVDFARKIFSVPKEEIDKKEKEYQAAKQERKGHQKRRLSR